MQAHDLKQAEMAEVLGASLSRVKAITSGRVQKLKREETEALITKLHVRGDWLATGEGPMQQSAADLQALLNPLSQDEQVLLDSYRRCTPQARQHLIQTAALLSAGVAPTGQGAAGISQTQHGGGIQIGQAGGPVQIGAPAPRTRKRS